MEALYAAKRTLLSTLDHLNFSKQFLMGVPFESNLGTRHIKQLLNLIVEDVMPTDVCF